MTAALVRRTHHSGDCFVEAFYHSDTFVVFSSSRAKVGAGFLKDNVTEATGQIGTTVSDNATRGAMTGDDVFHEDV